MLSHTLIPCKTIIVREDHDPALDIIHHQPPGDHWPHFSQLPLLGPFPISQPPAAPLPPHQLLDDTCSSFGVVADDPPELIDLVRQLPIAELDQTNAFLADSSTSTACFPDRPPRKAARRGHASGVRGSDTADDGVGMIALLFDCAVAISDENFAEANRMLHELTHAASPYSLSCAERVVAYFAKAMASRVINSWTGICSPLISNSAVISAFEAFGSASPFVKFAHFTANQAILEAFHRKDRVHIVDLDIMQGLQWPALLHLLATRAGGPPLVRMTGFGSAAESAGKRLSDFARRLGVPFEFRPIAKRPGEVHPSAVACREGEELAVHWLRHGLYDAAGCDGNAMRLVEVLRPRVVTLVEQEIAHAGGSFFDRFVGALRYYCAMFDALGASMAVDDARRHAVEHGVLSREIDNILAVGGPGRSGEQKFESWRAELARRGFVQLAMSRNAMAQAELILNLFPCYSHGHNILHGDGTVKMGWKDTGLYTASAWTTEQQLINVGQNL